MEQIQSTIMCNFVSLLYVYVRKIVYNVKKMTKRCMYMCVVSVSECSRVVSESSV